MVSKERILVVSTKLKGREIDFVESQVAKLYCSKSSVIKRLINEELDRLENNKYKGTFFHNSSKVKIMKK